MSVPAAFLILLWSSIAGSLPLAPAPPDFNADFSKRESDLMPVVGEDELQSLRHTGFQEQLHHLRQQNIGRNSATVTEEMAKIRNSIEDISEFSVDSNEVDEAINDITVPTDTNFKKSSKFNELAQIHNTDSSNKSLPPFAFSEDQQESETHVETVEVVPPTTTVILTTLPTTTPISTTRTTTQPPTHPTTTLKYVHIDSDVSVPRRTEITMSSTPMIARTSTVPIEITTTTLAPTTQFTTRYISPSTTRYPHIFSSSTVRLPSAIPIPTYTTFASRLPQIFSTTPRPSRGPFTTEFTIDPIQKRSEGRTSLRDRIRSTSQLLNLLGDKIEGIDQKAASNGAEPKTGVLTNVYDRGEIKHRNYRMKQWGISGEGRQGVQTYDGQFSGVAYGATKQRGGGYGMRKKIGRRPWKGYKTRKLGEKRPDYMRPSTFVEKKTTVLDVEPYGSKRRGEWIRGVKVSERRNAVRRVSESQKSFAQALMESEEASMRQLKKTLRQIREVVKMKTSSATVESTTTARPAKIKKNRIDSEFFNGTFDLRRRL
ncbi:hypothetical protein L5515_014573 [Caenorhabditis briggsae]|uniref:Uncharacterized protein n=1 Tax=Caenorhabditis briggsae TaxID=6238 RepID=A0AAE9EBT4_CAEBR|nr:hypothetical protein L5515_014573 [Caenorhabditis briggsae]